MFLFFVCVNILPQHMYMHILCVQKLEKMTETPKTQGKNGFQMTCGSWAYPDPLKMDQNIWF